MCGVDRSQPETAIGLEPGGDRGEIEAEKRERERARREMDEMTGRVFSLRT